MGIFNGDEVGFGRYQNGVFGPFRAKLRLVRLLKTPWGCFNAIPMTVPVSWPRPDALFNVNIGKIMKIMSGYCNFRINMVKSFTLPYMTIFMTSNYTKVDAQTMGGVGIEDL